MRLSKESEPCSSCTSLTPNFASAVLEEFQSLRIIFEGEVQSWIYFAHSSITVSDRACFESNQSSIDWSVLGRKERKSLLVRAFDVYCTVNVIARFKIIRCVKGCFYWNRFVFILTKSNWYLKRKMAGETVLYYFDGRGRAEIIRMVLCSAGVQVSTICCK